MNKRRGQISDSRRLAMILAISGGLMDAYTYIFRDEVFANAQTGNILLLGVNLSEGNYQKALHYFFPVIAFAVGMYDFIFCRILSCKIQSGSKLSRFLRLRYTGRKFP